jgi:hypothetical protein
MEYQANSSSREGAGVLGEASTDIQGERMTEESWKLVVYFDDQSPSFAHGFTCGKLWGKMQLGEPRIEETIMDDNLSLIRRMA